MRFRQILAAVLTAAAVLTVPTVSALGADGDITILVNNQEVQSENKPVIIEGTTFVPLRPAAEAMGCIVGWNDDTKTANISLGEKLIALQIGNQKISKYEMKVVGKYITDKVPVFSEEIVCDMPPRIIDNSTYIPLRAMAEALDAEVDWDEESRTVSITTNVGDTIENNAVYRVENDDTLVISGTGKIEGIFGSSASFSKKIDYDYDYRSIESLVIEEGITGIGEKCFNGGNFKSVSLPDSLQSIESRAFLSCYNLTSITIPEKVTNISDEIFYDCINITKITIPNSVTNIGKGAFGRCRRLTEITIPSSVTSIGERAFDGCTDLTEIAIPSGVTNIGKLTFDGCTSLTKVTLSNSLKSIGYEAFCHCESLEEITIPESTEEIDPDAFIACYNLKTVICKKGSAADNADLYPSGVTFVYQ